MLSAATIEKIQDRMKRAGLLEADLEESFVLGSGPGGQKVNKTAAAVRLTHSPSGQSVKCGVSRSREQNRWLARRALAERLIEHTRVAQSMRQQQAEKIRRQKRRHSRRQKARMLDDKRKHGLKKAARAPVRTEA